MVDMENTEALDEIRRELASLKERHEKLEEQHAKVAKQLKEWGRFIQTDVREDLPGKPMSLHLRCCALMLTSPVKPNHMAGLLVCNELGPSFQLYGSDGKVRAQLSVENDVVELDLFAKEAKSAVQLLVKEPSGQGQVNVFEAGKPRATMKATDIGASMAVVHDDGHVRLMLFGNEERGELIAVNQDMKTSVKICSDINSGPVIALHWNSDKPAVFLSATAHGGVVMVGDSKGNPIASLPSPPEAEE